MPNVVLSPKTPPIDILVLVGQIATVRANLARFAGNLARCVELSYQGLELLPETEKIFLASAKVNVGHAYLVSGDVTPVTERLVTDMLAPVRASGNVFATLRLTLLARLHALRAGFTSLLPPIEKRYRLHLGRKIYR